MKKIRRPDFIKELKPIFNEASGRFIRIGRYRCFCGEVFDTKVQDVKRNFKRTCGCIEYKKANNGRVSHGLTNHPLYYVWSCMKQRCYNKKNINYGRYGGRGINVCNEWRNDFSSFFNWSISNGWELGLELDRENNDGIYEPSNCRYVKQEINLKNKKGPESHIKVKYKGQTKTLVEWSEEMGIPYSTLYYRIKSNTPLKKLFLKEEKAEKDLPFANGIKQILKSNGLKQNWLILQLKEFNIEMTAPELSIKLNVSNSFTNDEKVAIEKILTKFK